MTGRFGRMLVRLPDHITPTGSDGGPAWLTLYVGMDLYRVWTAGDTGQFVGSFSEPPPLKVRNQNEHD